jgi:hypothetical protein
MPAENAITAASRIGLTPFTVNTPIEAAVKSSFFN